MRLSPVEVTREEGLVETEEGLVEVVITEDDVVAE